MIDFYYCDEVRHFDKARKKGFDSLVLVKGSDAVALGMVFCPGPVAAAQNLGKKGFGVSL